MPGFRTTLNPASTDRSSTNDSNRSEYHTSSPYDSFQRVVVQAQYPSIDSTRGCVRRPSREKSKSGGPFTGPRNQYRQARPGETISGFTAGPCILYLVRSPGMIHPTITFSRLFPCVSLGRVPVLPPSMMELERVSCQRSAGKYHVVQSAIIIYASNDEVACCLYLEECMLMP